MGPGKGMPEKVDMYPYDEKRRYNWNGRIRIALANSGPLQLELIQPMDNARSIYSDFLDSRGPGLHHVSSWPSVALYDRTYADMKSRNLHVAWEAVMPGG